MRVIVHFAAILVSACGVDAPDEFSPYQEKLPQRQDQTQVSSHANCYCFPSGSECHYGPFDDGPTNAPTDVPDCVDGEACYASSVWYAGGFEIPKGHCLRLCYHSGVRLTPDVQNDEFAAYLNMDCAAGEECILAKIDVGFEQYPRVLVGMCIKPPPSQTPETGP